MALVLPAWRTLGEHAASVQVLVKDEPNPRPASMALVLHVHEHSELVAGAPARPVAALSLGWNALEGQRTWIISLARVEELGCRLFTTLGGGGSFLVGPHGGATLLERGPTNLLYLRLCASKQGYATVAVGPTVDEYGIDNTFLVLVDSGAETNVAGDQWYKRLIVSPDGPGPSCIGVGGNRVSSLGCGAMAICLTAACASGDNLAARVAELGFDISFGEPSALPPGPPGVLVVEQSPLALVGEPNPARNANPGLPGAYPSIKTATELSRRLNVINPAAITNMHKVADGVERLYIREGEAYIDQLYMEAAGRRRAVLDRQREGSRTHDSQVAIGTTWSCDVTRRFIKSIPNGNRYFLVAVEVHSLYPVVIASPDQSGPVVIDAFDKLRLRVLELTARRAGGPVRLHSIRLDGEAAVSTGVHGDHRDSSEFVAWRLKANVAVRRSGVAAQAQNLVENVVKKLMHNLNVNSRSAGLGPSCWELLGVAAALQLADTTIPGSRVPLRRDMTRSERLTGVRPGLSRWLTFPGASCIVSVLDGKRPSDFTQRSVPAIYGYPATSILSPGVLYSTS